MNKSFFRTVVLVLFSTTILLFGIYSRVSKTPHGSKFSCNTCHTNGGGSSRNAFGLDVESRVTPDGEESFWGPELAALDSDRDSFTNGEELQDPTGQWSKGMADIGDANLVTNPGSADSFPTSIFDESNNFTFHLENNYPNPFNPATVIKYEIENSSFVSLKIYNSIGEEIRQLVSENQISGIYEVQFNAIGLSSGIYYYSIQAGDFFAIKKMMLLK